MKIVSTDLDGLQTSIAIEPSLDITEDPPLIACEDSCFYFQLCEEEVKAVVISIMNPPFLLVRGETEE